MLKEVITRLLIALALLAQSWRSYEKLLEIGDSRAASRAYARAGATTQCPPVLHLFMPDQDTGHPATLEGKHLL
jgi:hypothetical protein